MTATTSSGPTGAGSLPSIITLETGLKFGEVMRGSFSRQVTYAGQDVELFECARDVIARGGAMTAWLSIFIDDVARFIADPLHEAKIQGTVLVEALHPKPMTVSGGRFRLFVADANAVDTWWMRYSMALLAEDGKRYELEGFKRIHASPWWHAWYQTTTLYASVRHGGVTCGQGIIRVHLTDFIRQMKSMKPDHASGWLDGWRKQIDFFRFFLGVCATAYLNVLVPPSDVPPSPDAQPPSPANDAADYWPGFETVPDDPDGLHHLLHYPPEAAGEPRTVLLIHDLGMSSLTFAFRADTGSERKSLAERLHEAGYDVWLLDYRASSAWPHGRSPMTGDEIAAEDIPWAIETVCKATGREKIHVIAHGFGALVFCMAALGGFQDAFRKVESAICLQVATDVAAPWQTRLMVRLKAAAWLRRWGIYWLTGRHPHPPGAVMERVRDALLTLYANLFAQGRCRNGSCHRVTFMLGSMFRHDRLGRFLHDRLGHFFGDVSTAALLHCSEIVREGHVVSAGGEERYVPNVKERMDFPVTLIQSLKGRIWLPEGTQKSLERLQAANPGQNYRRMLLPLSGDFDPLYDERAMLFEKIQKHFADLTERPEPSASYTGPRPPMYTLDGVLKDRNLDCETIYFNSADAHALGLHMLRFHKKDVSDPTEVVLLIHGLTSSSDMFIMPEQNQNLVSYLLQDGGYSEVWCLDSRISARFPYDLIPHCYCVDDIALFDYPPALKIISERYPDAKVKVVAHCVGALSFLMSLCGLYGKAGYEAYRKVTHVAVNSVGLTPRVPTWTHGKLVVAPPLLKLAGLLPYLNPSWCEDPGVTRGRMFSWLVDLIHRECDSSVCHMLSFLWGTGRPAMYLHENLVGYHGRGDDGVTHGRLDDLFGGTGVSYFPQILKCVNRGHSVKYDPGDNRYQQLPDDYLDNLGNVSAKVKFLFMTGDLNYVWVDSNIASWEMMNRMEPGRHGLEVVSGYGHQDVFQGKSCERDVFPALKDFLSS